MTAAPYFDRPLPADSMLTHLSCEAMTMLAMLDAPMSAEKAASMDRIWNERTFAKKENGS